MSSVAHKKSSVAHKKELCGTQKEFRGPQKRAPWQHRLRNAGVNDSSQFVVGIQEQNVDQLLHRITSIWTPRPCKTGKFPLRPYRNY